MIRFLSYLLLCCWFFWSYAPPTALAKAKTVAPPSTIACYSGGREILRSEIVSGPFADEYKFAHEVTVKDETGEHSLNFAGGLCIIERGVSTPPTKLAISDLLSCYSGKDEVVSFEIYGRESTVDEYVEGRTFWAKSRGLAFNTNNLKEYLVFGGGACIGRETSLDR